jgi:hypothetical protein
MMHPFCRLVQFAHGSPEVRAMSRHPKYKTEECRLYHTTGACPYGIRCHFVHESPASDDHPQPVGGVQVSQTQVQDLLPDPVLVNSGSGVWAGPGAHVHSMHGRPPQTRDGWCIGKMQQLGMMLLGLWWTSGWFADLWYRCFNATLLPAPRRMLPPW